jgi:hypothetical protein
MANHLANARYIIGLLAVVSLTAISVHGAEMSCEAVSHYSPATWSVTALPAQLRACPEISESTFDRVKYWFTTLNSYHMLWW